MSITVSVTCPNCGNTVVLTLTPPIEGGFCEFCYNCGAMVSGSYSWHPNGGVRLYNIRSSGGQKR